MQMIMKCKSTPLFIIRASLNASLLVILLLAYYGSAAAADRLELDSTSIVGSKELPKILYIVPWKNTKLSTLDTSLEEGAFDSTMVPLDRYVFRREIKYQQMLQVENEGVSP